MDSASLVPEDVVRQEARRFWRDSLMTVPPAEIPPEVPQSTCLFLTEVGLPSRAPLGVMFYQDERLLRRVVTGGSEYLVLGDDFGTTLGLRVGTAELCAVDPDGRLPTRFVNSHTAAFISFLGLFDRRQPTALDAADDLLKASAQALRQSFESRDPTALEDAENWWSTILEQMEDGLL